MAQREPRRFGTLRSSMAQLVAAMAIGLVATKLIAGLALLRPTNIGWLQHGDPTTYYLGWAFFRHSPWTIPLGANPTYGLDLASSVVYSDSLPLLAIMFKAIGPLLPEPFQYFGWWIALCFVLQAAFGWALMARFTPNMLPRAVGAAFFAIAPPIVWRLSDKVGHLALAGQFLILAAFVIALRRPRRGATLWWTLLLGVAASLHAYLFAMVAALWLGDLADRFLAERPPPRRPAIEVALVGACSSVAMWLTGSFLVVSGITDTWGYGVFSFNLLSLFDPGRADYGYLSRLLPDLPGDGRHHESFTFLGIGMIVLLAAALLALPRMWRDIFAVARRHALLLAAVVALALFAITPLVAIGDAKIGVEVTYRPILRIANIFRASARMIWPAYYALYLFAFYVVLRGYRARVAAVLLTGALVLQVADMTAGWRQLLQAPRTPASRVWRTPLTSPFWACASGRYGTVRHLTVAPQPPDWPDWAYYAGTHGLGTDLVYLARYPKAGVARLADRRAEALRTGRLDPDTLFVLDGLTAAALRPRVDGATVRLRSIDGKIVAAPVSPGKSDCIG